MRNDHTILKACRKEATEHTPVWLMRQAGRYMPEYRAIRAKNTFLEVSKSPKLCAEVTLQPAKAFAVDAAIIFADIMTPLEGIGIDYDIEPGVGPVIANPIKELAQLDSLRKIKPEEDVDFLLEAIEAVVKELNDDIPVIGFGGAPFTLACYILEGRGARNFDGPRRVMYSQPKLWDGLMSRLADMLIDYMRAQVHAGVQLLQLFDSWVGLLSAATYREKVLPYSQRVLDGVKDLGVPTIHFGTGTGALLEVMAEAGGDVIGLDWRIPLSEGWARVPDRAVQGNLDPVLLLTNPEIIEQHIKAVLDQAGGRPGHIFNLGHGIIRQTPPEHVGFLVDTVHRLSKR